MTSGMHPTRPGLPLRAACVRGSSLGVALLALAALAPAGAQASPPAPAPVPAVALPVGPAAPGTPAAPAAPAPTGKGGRPVIAAQDLVVKNVLTPDSTSLLTDALQSLHEREFLVQNEDDSVVGPYSNIERFGQLIVLHDTPRQVEQIMATLAGLQTTLASGAPSALAELRVREYVPRHLSVSNLRRALEPFRRYIVNYTPSGSGGEGVQTENVVELQEPARLVLRDSEENLAVMVALLERLDVPPPQVLVTCRLLCPLSGEQAEMHGVSPELVAGLRALVPYESFEQVGFAALHASVVAGREIVVLGEFGNGRTFRLTLEPIGFDAQTGLLSLNRVRFDAEGQGLETGVTLRTGEDTVLGASGIEPIFVVLRVAALGG